MRSILFPTLLVALLAVPSIAPGEDLDLGSFETWEDYRSTPADPPPSIAKVARTTVVGQADNPPAAEVSESVEAARSDDYIILFGAGAALVVPYRLSDGAMDTKVLSEFSMSWAPFGIVGEIGADMAIAKNSSFIFRPNLKFYFVKSGIFSAYLEGSCAIYSTPDSTHLGGGGAIGLRFGVMEHLAIELRAGGSAFSMSGQASGALVDGALLAEGAEAASGMVLLPSVSARLMARF